MTAAMNILSLLERLEQILIEMDIPDMRATANITNVFWLTRNIQIKNKNHPRLGEARNILKRIIAERL